MNLHPWSWRVGAQCFLIGLVKCSLFWGAASRSTISPFLLENTHLERMENIEHLCNKTSCVHGDRQNFLYGFQKESNTTQINCMHSLIFHGVNLYGSVSASGNMLVYFWSILRPQLLLVIFCSLPSLWIPLLLSTRHISVNTLFSTLLHRPSIHIRVWVLSSSCRCHISSIHVRVWVLCSVSYCHTRKDIFFWPVRQWLARISVFKVLIDIETTSAAYQIILR